ncbi:MAG: COG3014 family protein [Candidatus Tectimicrobiota bacterium]
MMGWAIATHVGLWAWRATLGVMLAWLPGCATSAGHYAILEQQLARHDYAAADAMVAQHVESYGQRNAALYYLDRGLTLHLAGRYAESNAFLTRAEERIEALYTKSITTGVGALLTNDALLPYEGEDFEKVQLNLFMALNYVYLGQLDEALVEARKIDLKLTAYSRQYATKPVYKEDAFARYLSGILYEVRGELNDAFIAYRKALDAYHTYQQDYGTMVPPTLPADILRVTEALGLREEYATYRRQFPEVAYDTLATLRERGEIIYISYHGFAPFKQSAVLALPVPGSSRRPLHLVQLAFPALVPRPSGIAYAQLSATGAGQRYTTQTHLVQDVTAIASKDLQDRLGRVSAKTLARAATKYSVARGLEEGVRLGTGNSAAGILVGVLANLAGVASEQADTRGWRVLPSAFHLARLPVSPGRYGVVVTYYDPHGRALEGRMLCEIMLQAGARIFVSSHLIR